ncbi:hypothetical protein HYT04_02970 [Candidatus Kaiserbacteria bacterium]|nr:hypothetical protein [Candidatus Kaiserbacteria bacterium]
MKTITKEISIQAYQTAPQMIKDTVDSARTVSIIVEIGKKHNLHIDVFGKLAQINSYMLLGLATPQDLLQELVASGVLDKDAREIMNEINQKIFVPLREEMRRGGKVEETAKSAPPLASVPKYVPPKKYFNLQNKIPSPTPPAATTGTALAPATTKPMESNKLLEDHEEPHIDVAETPLRQALRKVVPPENLPGVIQPPPPPPVPPLPPPPQPKPIVPAAPYSSDPYREPIDENR